MHAKVWRKWALCAAGGFWAAATTAAPGDRAANVILFIGDGMGPEHVAAARCFKGAPLCFEEFPHFALVDTDSLGGPTDSSAAATAIATGSRVEWYTYGDRSDGKLPTVLEYFRAKGKRTGLVTTDHMTAATPAAFATHAFFRDDWGAIARDMLTVTRPHVLLGGGGHEMDPAAAAAAGYAVATNAAELAAIDPAATEYLSGQFGEGLFPYEADGIGDHPHLWEMTAVALAVLEREPAGFFLMVEDGTIDYASHGNHVERLVHGVLALEASVQTALDWARNRTDTLILVTADHETGGLAVTADHGPGNLPGVEWASDWHTQTPVGSWAWGVGSERVFGFMANTNTFHVLRDAALLRTFALASSPDGPPLWAAAPGDVFRIECADRLELPDWRPLGTITAVADSVAIADTNHWPQAQRFYRAVALP